MINKNLRWTFRVSLLAFALMIPANLQADYRRENIADREEALYRLDSQRAKDMERAYAALVAMLEKDQYIRVVFKNPTEGTKKYALKSLSAQGTFLTIKLVHLDDKDKVKGISLRASEIERLELEEVPW